MFLLQKIYKKETKQLYYILHIDYNYIGVKSI